ncbi:MAG: 16S rRNA (uracil(1498)-N(3))-methyltransferase [Candidatus Rokuibacteriota bacterium]
MRRFVIAPERIEGRRVTFGPEETRHLGRVLRLGPGDLVIASDGSGHEYTVRLDIIRPLATGTILEIARGTTESPLDITLVQGIPKGDKMETIVRVATELGVTRVMPAITARTVVRLESSRWPARARRWHRVAAEAAKQCGRAVIPDISPPVALTAAVEGLAVALRICLWEGERQPLGDVLTGLGPQARSVAVIVGPEGGLASEEVQWVRDRGWSVTSLGPRILRTETAGPAVLAILQATFGDLLRSSALSQK